MYNKDIREIFTWSIVLLIGLYFTIASISVLYFWVEFILWDTPIKCVTINVIYSILKGLMWPFFI